MVNKISLLAFLGLVACGDKEDTATEEIEEVEAQEDSGNSEESPEAE